jgi:hypothetical protein
MQLPLAYLDAAAIEEIPMDLWRKLLDAVGWPPSMSPAAFTHDELLRSLHRDTPSDELLLALETIHSLGTEGGRDAIVEAMTDRQVRADWIPENSSAREVAVHLYLLHRSNASLADVFARAQIKVQEGGSSRSYNEFLGKQARSVKNFEERVEGLRAETLRFCQARGFGDHVQVTAFEDDASHVLQVIHSYHTKKPLAVVEGSAARTRIEFRPVHADLIRYDAATGRLRIAASSPALVEHYRTLMGAILFDDASFFGAEPLCTLRPLQELGRKALDAHSVPGVGRVWMTDCLWERGDRSVIRLRARDCFDEIESLKLPVEQGDLLEAKLKIQIAGKSTRPVTVTIRVPSRIQINDKRFENLVDAYLAAVRIRCGAEPRSEVDLWGLDPWRHPASVWRALFHRETDVLVRAGVLFRVRFDAVVPAEVPGAGRALDAQPVDGEFYGVSRVPEIASRSLSATDVEGLELSPEAFGRHIGSGLNIDGKPRGLVGRELLDIGCMTIHDRQFRLVYVLAPPRGDLAAQLRATFPGVHVVLLIPAGRSSASGLPEVSLESPLPSREWLERAVLITTALDGEVPAIYSAPRDARLVVDTRAGLAWVDRVPIEGLAPDTHAFKFLAAVAKACPGAVSSASLVEMLSSHRDDGTTTARQAKSGAKRAIDRALKRNGGAGLDEDPFPSSGAGAYRCTLRAYVV